MQRYERGDEEEEETFAIKISQQFSLNCRHKMFSIDDYCCLLQRLDLLLFSHLSFKRWTIIVIIHMEDGDIIVL